MISWPKLNLLYSTILDSECSFHTNNNYRYKHVSDEYSFHKGGANTKDAHELIFARQSLVTHAKAFGLDAIDLVDTNFKGTHASILKGIAQSNRL